MHPRNFLSHILFVLIFLSGVFIAVGGIPVVSAAETTTILPTTVEYEFLAPLPLAGEEGEELGEGSLADYLSNMLKLIVALGGVLSVFVGVVGGIQYVASGITPSAKNDAKNRIQNALTGLVLILSSYLILNSINPNLVNISFELKNVATSSATVLDTTTSGSSVSPYKVAGKTTCYMGGSDCNDGYTCTAVEGADSLYGTCELSSDTSSVSQCDSESWNISSGSWPSDTYERNKILAISSSISFQRGDNTTCPNYGSPDCTSVCGLAESVITAIGTLLKDCQKYSPSCSLIINGGTEFWLHSSHKYGEKVDFDDNPSVFNSYVRDTTPSLTNGINLGTGYASCGYTGVEHYQKTLSDGTVLVFSYDNNSHWHVCFPDS